MSEWHPIRVVARRTGLTPHVIRAWEKRYGAVTPRRTETNRRLYSTEDVERLALLRRSTLAGRSIGQIARLSTDELRRLVEEDEAAHRAVSSVPTREPTKSSSDGDRVLSACLDATRNLDAGELQRALDRAAVALSRPVLVSDVVVPLMHFIGDAWQEGSLRAAHEHLATAVVRTFVGNLNGAFNIPETAPTIVVTTPAGQIHEIGALLAAAAASANGWRTAYLGPSLPADEIAGAARQNQARAVALSIVYPSDDPHLSAELTKLSSYLPPGTRLLVGGRGAPSYQNVLRDIGASVLSDFDAFVKELQRLRVDSG